MMKVTIDVAYAWLNTNEGHDLRPPLRQFYLHALQAKDDAIKAIDDKNPSVLGGIADALKERYKKLEDTAKESHLFIGDSFIKAVTQMDDAIRKQNRKEIETLCQQIANAGGSHLAPSTSDLILRLNGESTASPAGLQNAWQTVKLIENISVKLPDNMEAAEALTECGYAAYHLGNNEEAVRYFRQAIKKYNTPRHQIAMAEWMLGWVQWHTPGSRDQGFVALRSSIDKFEFLSEHAAFGREGVEWYRQRCKEMRDTLGILVQTGAALPVASPAPEKPAATPVQPKETTTTSAPPVIPSPPVTTTAAVPNAGAATTTAMPDARDFIRLFEVKEKIPAGGFEPTAANGNDDIGHVDIPWVMINDEVFNVKALRKGGRLINVLASGREYRVVKVTGDSMNKEEIAIGDYVLLRQQDDAVDQDIVAAEIVGVDAEATLKRFVRHNGKVILRPNSTNPNFQNDYEFDKNYKGRMYVRGVAYAVFKPVKLS
jgi:tetratricopeptide (TPR) repeat protein